jgi:hypothetical protein
MAAFLLALALFAAGALVCGVIVLVIRRRVPIESLRSNNETLAHYLGIVMALYGIFSGFLISSLWEQQRDMEETIVVEATELTSIIRWSTAFADPLKSDLQKESLGYARYVIEQEWPKMMAGDEHVAMDVSPAFPMWRTIATYEPQGDRENAIYLELLESFEQISDARRARIHTAHRTLPPYLWAIFLVGSVLCVGCTFFIGMESVRTQTILTGLCGGFIVLLVFVVYDLQGHVNGFWSASPKAFELARDRIAAASGQNLDLPRPKSTAK